MFRKHLGISGRGAARCARTKHYLRVYSIAQRYQGINRFVFERGWIEVGSDEFSSSFIRALDPGGMVWEGKSFYDSLDDALVDLERGLGLWWQENFGERS